VVWSEALAYCAWRQRGGRLPTEDEWEAAARGPHGFRYPWGDQWEPGRANADSLRDGFAPTGASRLGRSWVGAMDLIGNAWEWTAAAAADARGQPGHVIKGGAFDTPSANATAAYRAVLPDRRAWLTHTGFRCARGVGVVAERAAAPASVGRDAHLGRSVRGPRYDAADDSANRGARRCDDHHGRAPPHRADGAREPPAARSRRVRSLPTRELRARTADPARRAPRDRPVRERRAARSGLHARARPRRRRLRAVPRLGVGVSRPVDGGRAVSRVRRGGPRPAAGLHLRRRVDGPRLPPQLPESAHVRGCARGAAARPGARSAERGGTPPIRDGAALAGPRLRRRRHVPAGAPARA